MKLVACKICCGDCLFFASVDFSKHCNKQLSLVPPSFEIVVDQYKFLICDFIFTSIIDDYIKFDPLYPRIRPEANARLLSSVIQDAFLADRRPKILDYGAGNGMLSQILEDEMPVENYDTLNPAFDRLPADDRFGLIFCAEVVEHIPDPHSFMDDWQRLRSARGCVLFSTETQPADIDTVRANWWYLGPRNGHVSRYAHKTLQALCARHDMLCESLGPTWHLAFKHVDHDLDLAVLKNMIEALPTGFIEI
jgi:2-polyprenyl-3-methyl-5-hydroxy-6-metoxy-1,4-benzoquinol methylase